MKKLKFLINNGILITTALLVVQIVWLILFILKLSNYSIVINILFTLISLLIVLHIVVKDENASYKIAWIILIMALPLFGGLLYLIFGDKRPSKGMQILLDRAHKQTAELLDCKKEMLDELGKIDKRAMGTFRYLQEGNKFPVYQNTESKYYPSGEDMYKDMLLELEKAKKFIFLEYFIIAEGKMWDGILEILVRKAAQGVDVRLLYDDVGSLFLLPKDFAKNMEDQGIKCMAFNRFRPFLFLAVNNRNHRKILVIDGHTAFTGGLNIADEYINEIERFGYWKDTGIMLKGQAVWSFTLMFLEMWNAFNRASDDDEYDKFKADPADLQKYKSDGYMQPYSDSPIDDEPVGERVYIEILTQAKDYVYIFTPYLIIDNEMKDALCMAAKRGVDVRIVTPGIPDKKIIYRLTRSNYEPLLKAGVKIYEYSPGFIHAKSYVSDDEIGVVGTINMDFRSLYLHFECGVLMYKSESIMDLKRDSIDTINMSKQVNEGDMKKGRLGRFFDAILRLVSPLT